MRRKQKRKRTIQVVTYDSLWESWWEIYDGYSQYKSEAVRGHLVTAAFEELLKQVGWTIDQWNSENARKEK
jgi:hypothetical protein